MKGLLKKAYDLIRPNPPQTYRYEQYAKDPNGEPVFKWIDEGGNWHEGDYRGKGLPRNASREYSDSAYEWQKLQLDSGNLTPWVKRPITK